MDEHIILVSSAFLLWMPGHFRNRVYRLRLSLLVGTILSVTLFHSIWHETILLVLALLTSVIQVRSVGGVWVTTKSLLVGIACALFTNRIRELYPFAHLMHIPIIDIFSALTFCTVWLFVDDRLLVWNAWGACFWTGIVLSAMTSVHRLLISDLIWFWMMQLIFQTYESGFVVYEMIANRKSRKIV